MKEKHIKGEHVCKENYSSLLEQVYAEVLELQGVRNSLAHELNDLDASIKSLQALHDSLKREVI